jgi:hypothetical protein
MNENINHRTTLLATINRNLLESYDFCDKTIVTVGAGGGQIIDYALRAKKIIAVDNNEEAVGKLHTKLLQTGLREKFSLIHSEFLQTRLAGDLVFFEFCLHEMADPEIAIDHAFKMAPMILVADHCHGSEWAFVTGEDEKATRCWNKIGTYNIVTIRRYNSFQFFDDYDALHEKIRCQGLNSIRRISGYKGRKNILIPMTYCIALIKRLLD